jgi:phosphoribosylformylglycinamidine synthase
VIRLKGTDKALSISTDCNGKYVYLNPRVGAKMAVAEAARNVVCSGAHPLAITNCLNFGNPQDPEIYWQFKEAVLGIGDMCREINTPVTGGNVSFYNETFKSAVYPTPVIGMVGLIEDLKHITTLEFKNENDLIVMIGSFNVSLGGSSYLKYKYGRIEGPLATFSKQGEGKVQSVCLEAIHKHIIKSAHDISDGGLSVNIAESVCFSKKGMGAEINIDRKLRSDEILFGETQGVIIVSLDSKNLHHIALLAQDYNIHTQTIGFVTDTPSLKINDLVDVKRSLLEKNYFKSLESTMVD